MTCFIDKFKLDPLVYLFSFGLVIGQAIFPTWFFQGIQKMQVITIVTVGAKLFFTLSLFFVVFEGTCIYLILDQCFAIVI